MAAIDKPWVNVLAGVVGGLGMGLGLGMVYNGAWVSGLFWAVLGFLVVGWAVFDRRRFRRGTPESKGKTVE